MKTRTLTTRTRRILAPLCCLFCLALLDGCGSRQRLTPVASFVGVDASVSTRHCQPAYVALISGYTGRLEPDCDHLTIYRVERQTFEIFDDRAPGNQEAMQARMVAQLRKHPREDGTYPALFWKTVAERAEHASGKVLVTLYSDGDNDDQTETARETIRAAARRLAANPHVVAVAICGVNPDNRAALRRLFQPCGDRLLLFGPDQLDQNTLHRLHALVQR